MTREEQEQEIAYLLVHDQYGEAYDLAMSWGWSESAFMALARVHVPTPTGCA